MVEKYESNVKMFIPTSTLEYGVDDYMKFRVRKGRIQDDEAYGSG